MANRFERAKESLEVLRDLFLDVGWKVTRVEQSVINVHGFMRRPVALDRYMFEVKQTEPREPLPEIDFEWVSVALDESDRITLSASWGDIAGKAGEAAIEAARAVIERAGLGSHLAPRRWE
jgi:hypothetical protein